jgi:palmitoyltransferase ZDHHC9/14/18
MRPRPPTYLRFRDEYEEGDQRYGDKKAVKKSGGSKEGVEMVDMEQGQQARN